MGETAEREATVAIAEGAGERAIASEQCKAETAEDIVWDCAAEDKEAEEIEDIVCWLRILGEPEAEE